MIDNSFWHMGGYGLYVWSSYGLSLIAIVALLLAPKLRRQVFLKTLQQKLKRQQRLAKK